MHGCRVKIYKAQVSVQGMGAVIALFEPAVCTTDL